MGIVTAPDCVIFAAGDRLPREKAEPYLRNNPFVIAADAGYSFSESIGCQPNLIVGDFDSGDCPQTETETLRLSPIKDDTDSAVALSEAIKRGFRRIVLFGATGGRLDHTFANFDLCAYAKAQGVDLMLVDSHHQIFALREETAEICDAENKYVSVFAVGGACTVSLEGFYYPLSHYVFAPFCGLGVSNEVTEKSAQIIAEHGTALIFITDKD